MKRTLCLLLALVLLLPVLPSAAARQAAPDFTIQSNRLCLNGTPVGTGYIYTRFDFLLIRAADYTPALRAQCDVEDLTKLDARILVVVPGAENVQSESIIKATGAGVSLSNGDVLLARSRHLFTNDGQASEWCMLTIDPSMSTPDAASSAQDLPALTVTESSLTAVPENVHTRYEYTKIPEKTPADFTPEWIPMGSASDHDGTSITARFQPSGTPYLLCVRIEGDDKPGFLFAKVSGIPLTSPKVLYALEKLGPLNGGESGGTWYFSSNGGKKWDTITAEPGEEIYIDLSKVFAKKEVPYQLKKAATATDEDGEPTLTPPAVSPSVLSGTFKARPQFPKSAAVTAFVSEQYSENWTIKGTKEKLEYSSDGVEWSPLNPAVGLPLLTAEEQAAGLKPIAYQVRVAPSESASLPASAPKKFNQVKQPKMPAAKPDYKKEIIKIKNGLKYCIGEPGLTEDMTFTMSSGSPISIEQALNTGQVIYVYTPENGKKPRSAIQTVQLAERAESPDEGEGFVANKNTFALDKAYEYYGSKNKWGGFVKGDTTGMLRTKATAKYNAKTNENSGLAASVPVKCGISYAADGKNIQSVTMEQKKAIPLQSWNITALTGGTATTGSGGVSDTRVSATAVGGTVSFTVSPVFSAENQALVESFTLALNETEIEPVNGVYALQNLRVGDTVSLLHVPKDKNTYRKGGATIKITPPPEQSPRSVAFGSAGSYGDVTVRLTAAVPLGQSRTIKVDLVQMPEGKVLSSTSATMDYSPLQPDSVSLDLKQAFTSAGPGTYELRAYCAGNDPVTSDSVAVTATRTFTAEDFGVRTAEITAPNPLRPGDTVTAGNMLDSFGNELTGSAYQWYRVSPTTGTRYTILTDGNAASYTVTSSDVGYTLEVLIYSKGAYFTQSLNRQVTS